MNSYSRALERQGPGPSHRVAQAEALIDEATVV